MKLADIVQGHRHISQSAPCLPCSPLGVYVDGTSIENLPGRQSFKRGSRDTFSPGEPRGRVFNKIMTAHRAAAAPKRLCHSQQISVVKYYGSSDSLTHSVNYVLCLYDKLIDTKI